MLTGTEPIRLSVDTGGTFTDLAIDLGAGGVFTYKSSTTPTNPVEGILAALEVGAADLGTDVATLLGRSSHFVHGTTRATNAVVSGEVARTALLVTEGHPDILLWRESGRIGTFDHTVPYPKPYVPRRYTYELAERVGADGSVVTALEDAAVESVIERLEHDGIEAVAVCLLWSVVNPAHEQRVGELLRERLPDVPVTLSHALSPTIREYRRASAAVIDASLKPLMRTYLGSITQALTDAGFHGRAMVMTSGGAVLDAEEVAEAPIHTLGSGPAAAPVAGRYFTAIDGLGETAIVTDAGGTSYDVSLVRRGEIPWTREARLGREYYGPMTGFPSVDVKSVGAGGGSIAWIDASSILRVGPASAGADPGPVCYGRGGRRPTVTDASLVLGYLDPDYFLGGRIALDHEAAREAIRTEIAEPLGYGTVEAAAAILEVAAEGMVNAIEDIAISQGVDPRSAVIVSGGGSGGFQAAAIARRLGTSRVIVPRSGPTLSAVGALISDLSRDFSQTLFATTADFPSERVNEMLEELERGCRQFVRDGAGVGSSDTTISFFVEARYPEQVWELEVPLVTSRFESDDDVRALETAFHDVHRQILGISDPGSPVELVTWRAQISCRLPDPILDGTARPRPAARNGGPRRAPDGTREMYFSELDTVQGKVVVLDDLAEGDVVLGPAVIESPETTIVCPPGASAMRLASGSISLTA